MRNVIHPAAWKTTDFYSVDDLAFDLDDRDVKALADAIAPWSGREPAEVDRTGRREFPLAGLGERIARLRCQLMDGRGLVVVRRFPVRSFSEEEIGLMFRALCCHLGHPLCQSKRRERIGFVAHRPDRALNLRGYERAEWQMLHTDMDAILGMLCVRRAREGGESRVASALTIHNEIAAARPELLAPLYAGFPIAWGEEPSCRQAGDASEYEVPVFSWNEGRLSVCFLRPQGELAARLRGETLSQSLIEALDFFETVSERDEVALELPLDEGDGYFINNFNTLHARNGFVDWHDPKRGRLLLRSWLEVPDAYPISPGLARYYADLRSAYGEDLPHHEPLPADPVLRELPE